MDTEPKPKRTETDSNAYEEHWYRQLKAWGELPGLEEATDDTPEPEPLSAADDMSTVAAIEALEAIAEIGGPGAVDALIACLRDPEPRVRVRALQLLGETGDPRAVFAVRSVNSNDSVPQVLTAARMALAKLGEPV